jgi:hypothetical protein
MSLPKDFFTQLEQYSELSNKEKAVFAEIFGNSKSRVEVTQAFHISESNLRSCLTGIYKKFSISGSGPVKETRLREYLQKRYSQQKPSGRSTADVAEDDIDALVQEIREKIKPSIKQKCGTMRVLDMDQPIELTGERGIYTNVNILEKTTKHRRVKIGQLLQKFDRIDNLAASDEKLQHFLEWLDRKSSSFESFYKPAAIRALYFTMTLDSEQNKLDNALEWDSENTLSGLDNALGLDLEDTLDDIEIDWLLNHALTNTLVLSDDLANAFFQGLDATGILDETIDKSSRGQALVARDDAWCNIADIDDFLINALDLASCFQSELKTALQLLRDKLNEAIPEWENLFEELEEFGEWWEKNSQAWTEQLIALMIEYRNIGHNWQFSYRQAQLLQQYYNSNKLLVNCLEDV